MMKWWRKRQRAIDMEILWPVCKEQAATLEHAKAAFAVHVYNDVAWRKDFSESELFDYIEALT